jgi:hypothetical protein
MSGGHGVNIVTDAADQLTANARGTEHPFLGGQGFHLGRAAVEQQHLDVQAFFLVPTHFLGVPDVEARGFVHPAGGNFNGLVGCQSGDGAAADDSAHAQQKRDQKQFSHA